METIEIAAKSMAALHSGKFWIYDGNHPQHYTPDLSFLAQLKDELPINDDLFDILKFNEPNLWADLITFCLRMIGDDLIELQIEGWCLINFSIK